MRAQDKSNLIKVGLLLISLTVVLMIMVTAIGKESALFSRKALIRAQVKNAENLKAGAVVELRGLRIGHIQEIKIVGLETVEIQMLVLADNLRWLRRDSKVALSHAGLVGDKYLEILGGSETSEAFDAERDVLTSEPSIDFKAIAAKGGGIADRAERVLTRMEQILEAIDPKQISTAVTGIARSAEKLSEASAPFVATARKMEKLSENMADVSSRLKSGPGTAHSLVYDDQLYQDLRKLLGGAERNSVIKYFIRESIKKAPEKTP
jgi:phospholipid/cholesterol/gamma-HCH transport system substrate-binding protein